MSCGLILFLVKRIEGGDEALCGEEGDVRRSMAVRRIQLWWRGSIKAKSPHKYVDVLKSWTPRVLTFTIINRLVVSSN